MPPSMSARSSRQHPCAALARGAAPSPQARRSWSGVRRVTHVASPASDCGSAEREARLPGETGGVHGSHRSISRRVGPSAQGWKISARHPGGRSASEKGRYALESAERQDDAGLAQCGVSSALAADLAGVDGPSARRAHTPPTGVQPGTSGCCLLESPHPVGAASSIKKTGVSSHSLFLAAALSQMPSCHLSCFRGGLCNT